MFCLNMRSFTTSIHLRIVLRFDYNNASLALELQVRDDICLIAWYLAIWIIKRIDRLGEGVFTVIDQAVESGSRHLAHCYKVHDLYAAGAFKPTCDRTRRWRETREGILPDDLTAYT